ncbi:MAG TPA: hypothetical protein VLT86_13695 [Vicinamibacterales bacterium]|nr:hypothetical protein [Vicinamibacterales bacterium]
MRGHSTCSLATACSLAVVTGLLAPARLAAQDTERPTMSVMPFEGSGVSGTRAGQMADELAARLVETGRFRVLLREWLPVRRNGSRPSMTALREAAAFAGVQYLVFGSVAQTVSRAGSRPVTPATAGYGNVMVLTRAVPLQPPVRRPGSFITLDVRVVDVASGDVVRTAAAQEPVAARAMPLPPIALRALPRSPVTGALALALMIHAHKSPLDGGCQHAIAEIAHTLPVPPAPAR